MIRYTLLYHIYGSLTLDFVQCINDFFKLFSLNLHTVSVDNHPASVEIFLCQLTQFLFPDATNGEGCDTFFECSGAAVPAMQMTDITRVRGKICIVSVHKKPHEVNLRDVNFKEQTVVGTRVYTKEEFGRAAELTKELEAELEKIVTHVVPLKESDKVFDMIADPECGTIKIVVDCENV